MGPLFEKYRSKSGRYYLYDSATNEIVRVGETVYHIADDFHVLSDEEVFEKHQVLGKAAVQEALSELRRLQHRDIFRDHVPERTFPPERVLCQGKEYSFAEFLRKHRRLLVIELTERCNLRCEYCCYGKHYSEQQLRGDGEDTISLEAARIAITDFVNHRPPECAIGFYGGEPLLAFDRLREIVLYADHLAAQHGLRTAFSLTTNGTLLNDRIIHFLIKHDFGIAISLDGPARMHDRYRVYRNVRSPNGQRRGTHGAVVNNIKRLFKLYPNYRSLNVIVVLTATSEPEEINRELSRLERLNSVTVTFVRNVWRDAPPTQGAQTLHIGRFGPTASSPRAHPDIAHLSQNNALVLTEEPEEHGLQRKVGEVCQVSATCIPDFCRWTKDRRDLHRRSYDCFIERLCRETCAETIRRKFPLYCSLFLNRISSLHRRSVSMVADRNIAVCRCSLGSFRTFCTTDGVYYPCEKMDAGIDVGGIEGGVDVGSAIRLTELCRLLGDCGNCTARTLCDACPAAVPRRRGSGGADAFAFQRNCGLQIDSMKLDLEEYVSVMESNEEIVEKLLHRKDERKDWIFDVHYLAADCHEEDQVDVEESIVP